MSKTPTYQSTQHVCRFCGMGRIMRQTNSGPTGGGNPVWWCATCGHGGASLTPNTFCYCGYTGRTSEEQGRYWCWTFGTPSSMKEWSTFLLKGTLLVMKRQYGWGEEQVNG